MRENKEYTTCKAISDYLRLQYPHVLYHWDLTGLNLSMVQASMAKQIQHGKGWPDLFIAESRGGYHGLFLEIKPEGAVVFKKNGDYKTPHLEAQALKISQLAARGYAANFVIGFTEAKYAIDGYLDC